MMFDELHLEEPTTDDEEPVPALPSGPTLASSLNADATSLASSSHSSITAPPARLGVRSLASSEGPLNTCSPRAGTSAWQ